jgi:Uma2 family endonuclease
MTDSRRKSLRIGEIFTVEIEKVAHGGHFIARHEGVVIFVRHAIPGEIVEVEITALEKSFDWISPDEYLAGEAIAESKSEYLDGKVYAMAGATRAHNIISTNALVTIGSHLRGKPCQPFGSDMRVRMPAIVGEIYYYPDVSVTCDPSDTADLFIEKPVLIIEVLSPETRRTDLREKRLSYFSVPSLEAYLILEQDHPAALLFEKIDGNWQERIFSDRGAEVSLNPIQLKIPLADFYTGVTFPPATPSLFSI